MNKEEILQLLSETENDIRIAIAILINNGWSEIGLPEYEEGKMPNFQYEIIDRHDAFIYLKSKEIGLKNTLTIRRFAKIEFEEND